MDIKDLEESYRLAEKLDEKYKDYPEIFFFQSRIKKSKLRWVLNSVWLSIRSILAVIIFTFVLVWHRLVYKWLKKKS